MQTTPFSPGFGRRDNILWNISSSLPRKNRILSEETYASREDEPRNIFPVVAMSKRDGEKHSLPATRATKGFPSLLKRFK